MLSIAVPSMYVFIVCRTVSPPAGLGRIRGRWFHRLLSHETRNPIYICIGVQPNTSEREESGGGNQSRLIKGQESNDG